MEISIIVPVFNEAGNLETLSAKIKAVMDRMGKSYECIFIDDGSIDNSFTVLRKLANENNFIKVIKLKKNFGQTAAMAAGFDSCGGDVVVTMDADLQNDPEDIPRLLQKMDEGYDIVSGWRDKRKDPVMTRKLPSFVANLIIAKLTGVKLHDFGCTLKAYKKDVLKNIRLYGEMHRFIPAIASYTGISIAELRVRHHNRRYGLSKYGVSRTLKVLLDLITVKFFISYSAKPMQIFGLVGFAGWFVGAVAFILTVYMKLVKKIDITGNPLFHLTILMGIIGIQCILMGILGEMSIRIYHEILNKQTYVIEEIL